MPRILDRPAAATATAHFYVMNLSACLQALWKRSPRGHARRSPAPLGRLEPLEQRIAPATFVVTTVNDGGAGSLRDAISSANNREGLDIIHFDIPGVTGGPRVIGLVRPLPDITDSVVIDGYSQGGSRVNTLDKGNNAVINIVLDGTSAGAANGLTLASNDSVISGLAIHSFRDPSGTAGTGHGIIVTGSGNMIAGNFIGTDHTGSTDLGNRRDGIEFRGMNSGNVVGGSGPETRNLILGNGENGIDFNQSEVSSNSVLGNYIGTDRTGAIDRGNDGAGIRLGGLDNAVIRRNLISYNGLSGIEVAGPFFQVAPRPAGSGGEWWSGHGGEYPDRRFSGRGCKHHLL